MFRKVINIILISFVFVANIISQDFANIKAGALMVGVSNNDFDFRPGYDLGIAVRIGSPGFFMSPSLSYQKFTIEQYNKKEYLNKRPSYSLVKLNNDAGFEFKLAKWFLYRAYAGVNLNYILSIDNNPQNIDFTQIYDGFVGYDFGVGVTLGFITLDFKWEKSFTEFYKDINKTKLNFSTINVGFVF